MHVAYLIQRLSLRHFIMRMTRNLWNNIYNYTIDTFLITFYILCTTCKSDKERNNQSKFL